MSIVRPMGTFCADLVGRDGPGLEEFIAREHIAGGSVYLWKDIDDRELGYMALAPIPTYASWSAAQIDEAVQRVWNPVEDS
jgi:hypothetical protein